MSLVSTILIWREGETLCARLTTNVNKSRMLARLTDLGIVDSVDEIHAFFGDRADGGNGYDLVWKQHVRWSDVSTMLARL